MRPTATLIARFVFDDNIDVLVEEVQEAEQPIQRESAQMTAQESRNFGLVNLEHASSLDLVKTAPLD